MAWRLIYHFHLQLRKSFLKNEVLNNFRFVSTSSTVYVTQREISNAIALKDRYFDQETKNKETFLDLLEVFKMKNYKAGHIEFIYAALNRMEDYGVDEDLECYKNIIDVMPKGKMMAINVWQGEYDYYPKHQDCINDVVSKMEAKRVMPDRDTVHLVQSIFGKKSSPGMKLLRMLYWMPKMKYASPWPPPVPLPKNEQEAAVLAVKRMCSVDLETEITVFRTSDDELSTRKTWIVSAQSPVQKTLLQFHPQNAPVYLDGTFRMHLGRKNVVDYFVLKADLPKNRRRRKIKDPDEISNLKIPFVDPPTPEDLIPEFSVHEQRDGIIYGTACIGSMTNDTLQSWIRLLQRNGNPKLGEIPVVFRCSFPEDQSNQEELPQKSIVRRGELKEKG